MSLPQVNPMPAVVCHACAWWAYDVKPDSPRGGHARPAECPTCRTHHNVHRALTPAWVRFEPRTDGSEQ